MKKSKGKNSRLIPTSLRIISSCLRNVSTNASTAVRTAGASVAASISASSDDRKEQVLWAGFDKLELSPTSFRCVLLLGYLQGFQVFDVEDASGFSELISRRDGPVSFLQMLPYPANSVDSESNEIPRPILVVVGGGDEDERMTALQSASQGTAQYGSADSSVGSSFNSPTAVRFYSMKLNEYVKVIDFKSAVFMVRCSPQVVAIGLEEQIYCYDTLTLEKKVVVMTFPVPRVRDQGAFGINTGYGPMAVGPRWLAYPPSRPLMLNTGRVSPKSLASTVSPSTSPANGTLMARCAVESSKFLASGILTLGDMGYKKLSKYCPELLPDGSSSSFSFPGAKHGKLAEYESENIGLIAVKDIVSSEVISHFRAHTSPISALCFDPSGTILVTASVFGNNINVFRIMPSQTCTGSGYRDWSTSYVQLYKLHRGVTTAVIQDICFSSYSQWIAVLSSKGTCHIFYLSPFGGDVDFRALNTRGQGTYVLPASTQPWWSNSSFTTNKLSSSAPPPCTPSVVTRIKCSDTGFLNTMSHAAASMAGRISVPSGAVAAVFHNSNSKGSQSVNSSASSLEHILVYAPSGFVVQHDIQLSTGLEFSETRAAEFWSNSQVKPQTEEIKVKVEPAQWWDVCRRLDNLEREECISGSIFDGDNDSELDDNPRTVVSEKEKLLKSPGSHMHLSNAEVQINSGRLPILLKPKIHLHSMESPIAELHTGGEFEIERTPSHVVEVRHKGLLPVFDHHPGNRSSWADQSIPSEARYSDAPSDTNQARDKTNEASIFSHSDPPSFSSTESSEGGSKRIEKLLDLDHMSIDNPKASPVDKRSSRPLLQPITYEKNRGVNKGVVTKSSPVGFEILPPLAGTNTAALDIVNPDKTAEFRLLFKDTYCDEPDINRKSTEVVTDEVDPGGNAQEEKANDDEGWLGGMFDFSEEG